MVSDLWNSCKGELRVEVLYDYPQSFLFVAILNCCIFTSLDNGTNRLEAVSPNLKKK